MRSLSLQVGISLNNYISALPLAWETCVMIMETEMGNMLSIFFKRSEHGTHQNIGETF